jgi:outer membrane protein TolC
MRRATAAFTLCSAAALLAAAPVRAAEPTDSAAPAAGAPSPAPAAPSGTLRLGLEEAARMAIDNNLDVELLRVDPLLADQDLTGAWGAYDPEIFGIGGYSDIETPTANRLLNEAVLNDRSWDGEGGLRGLIPWLGGAYSLSYGGSELETNSNLSTLSPDYRANLLATLQVPVLRNLFWSQPWTAVRLTRIGVDASRERFEAEIADLVRGTENAYWGLIAARDATRVARKSLETASALLELTRAQYEVGVVSKVEVVQAEAGVADRDFRLIAADAIERNAQDALVDVVLGPYLAPRSEVVVEPTDAPDEIPVREVDPEAATERAFARRAELALARSNIEQRQVALQYASNQRLPQLDVVASYGNAGLAGNFNNNCGFNIGGFFQPCDPVGVPQRWSAADDDFLTSDAARSYTVQGILSIPLGNVRARSDYEKARLELHRAETALRRLEQSIVSDIRRAARNLRASIQGIEAAERGVAAANEQLRAERVRLEYGESTPFDVLLREDDLVRAENQRIFAQRAYHDAVTELDRAQGTILERNHIVVEEAAALR